MPLTHLSRSVVWPTDIITEPSRFLRETVSPVLVQNIWNNVVPKLMQCKLCTATTKGTGDTTSWHYIDVGKTLFQRGIPSIPRVPSHLTDESFEVLCIAVNKRTPPISDKQAILIIWLYSLVWHRQTCLHSVVSLALSCLFWQIGPKLSKIQDNEIAML